MSEDSTGTITYRIVGIKSWQLAQRLLRAEESGEPASFRAMPLDMPLSAVDHNPKPEEFLVKVESHDNGNEGEPTVFQLREQQNDLWIPLKIEDPLKFELLPQQ